MKFVRKRMQPDSEKAVDNFNASNLYFSSAVLSREVEKLAIECFKPAKLHPSLANILLYLTWITTTGPSFLAKTLFLSPSTMTRLLAKLEKLELVWCFEYDGVRMVQLAPKGRELEPTLSECAVVFERKCRELLGTVKPLTSKMNEATDILRLAAKASPRRQQADGISSKD